MLVTACGAEIVDALEIETPIPDSFCVECYSTFDADGQCVDCGHYDGGVTAYWMKINAAKIIGGL